MILKSIILLLLIIIVPDILLSWHFRRRLKWQKHMIWWAPSALMTVFAVYLAVQPHFIPLDPTPVNIFLFLVGLIFIPKIIISLCAMMGKRGRWPAVIGVVLCWIVLFYGTFVGFYQFEVKQVEIAFDDLPEAFDGYKIVQFSDAHVGSFTGNRESILKEAVDSINAQDADLIAFTGDLQNMCPKEIEPHFELLKTLKSKDGVVSVLGNHDYGTYMDLPPDEQYAMEGMTVSCEEDMGWIVLMNEHYNVYRDSSRLVIGGMENDGEGRFPALGNINSALRMVSRHDFVVMLEHDPTSWRRRILPKSHCQLTLSGHTHAMQFELFGWSPAAFHYHEYDGLYKLAGRYMYVSKGLGGVIPFRFGAPAEIVVITLRKSDIKNKN